MITRYPPVLSVPVVTIRGMGQVLHVAAECRRYLSRGPAAAVVIAVTHLEMLEQSLPFAHSGGARDQLAAVLPIRERAAH